MEKAKEAELQELSENNGDCSHVLEVFSVKFLILPYIFEERTLSKQLLILNLE